LKAAVDKKKSAPMATSAEDVTPVATKKISKVNV
jgi:hypothetical protein